MHDEMLAAMDRVLQSGWYLNGSELANFERHFSEYVGAEYAVGVANGFDALTLILMAMKDMQQWEDGDEVIVPALTFIATAEAVSRAGPENAGRGVASVGDFNEGIFDALRIHRRYLAPPLVVGFQMRQADVEKGRLEFVETAVQSQIFMMVFLRRTESLCCLSRAALPQRRACSQLRTEPARQSGDDRRRSECCYKNA